MHFFQSVFTEMKNVSWPNRKDLHQAVRIVLGAVFLSVLFLSGVDFAIARLLANFL